MSYAYANPINLLESYVMPPVDHPGGRLWCRLPMASALTWLSGEIQQCDVRVILNSFEHDFLAVRREIKVTNLELGRQVG